MRVLLLSLSVALLIVAIHQTMTVGLAASYFIYMLAVAALLGARLYTVSGTKVGKDAKK